MIVETPREMFQRLIEMEFEARGVPKGQWNVQRWSNSGFKIAFVWDSQVTHLEWTRKNGPLNAPGIRRMFQNKFGIARSRTKSHLPTP